MRKLRGSSAEAGISPGVPRDSDQVEPRKEKERKGKERKGKLLFTIYLDFIYLLILVKNIGARKLAEASRKLRGKGVLEGLTQYFLENVGARKLAEAMRKLRAEACLTALVRKRRCAEARGSSCGSCAEACLTKLVRNTGARKLAEASRKFCAEAKLRRKDL